MHERELKGMGELKKKYIYIGTKNGKRVITCLVEKT